MLRPALPDGWMAKPEAQIYTVSPHDTYAVSVWVMAPPNAQQNAWLNLTWNAQSQGAQVGQVTLRGHVDTQHMPQ
jgi:hypothetical protein